MKRDRRMKQDAELTRLLTDAVDRILTQGTERDQLLSKLRAVATALRACARDNEKQSKQSGKYAVQIATKARAEAYDLAAIKIAILIEDFE